MESKGSMHEQASTHVPQTPPPGPFASSASQHGIAFQQDINMSSPRTPQPQICSTPSPLDPPAPPKVRIKKRRPGAAPDGIPSDAALLKEDVRIPSIELSEPSTVPPASSEVYYAQHEHLGPSTATLPRSSSPPHTPLMKLQTTFAGFHEGLKTPEPWSAQSALTKGESITRPSSTWSEISDSSASSLSSFDTFATHLESCVSPDSESADPFVFPESKGNLMPSAIPRELQSLGKRIKKQNQAFWSQEMDEHLWLAYMTYLSDPTVTPFKTLPGTAPPLGVCHRVARRAKKNWKGSRTVLATVSEDDGSNFASLDATIMNRQASLPPNSSPSTAKPDLFVRSFSAGARRNPSRWPHSGSATRKRLRELCKHKPALSPHYQRLMHTRTPSPFESSSSLGHGLHSPRSSSDQSSFSTRDLNFTLSTSTASTMQPGNPLSQLASSSPKTPQRTNPHLKSQSLQSTFGIIADDQHHQAGLASLRRLASPFQEQSRREPVPSSSPQATLRPPMLHAPPQQVVNAPPELQHPKPLSASMKRRAQYQLGEELLTDDVELRQSFLEDIFHDPATASGKRRVRSRGFSLGAVRNASGASRQTSTQLSELFTPPTTTDSQPSSSVENQNDGLAPGLANMFQPTRPQRLSPAPTYAHSAARRLGSPFVPTGNIGLSNTFPRNLFPQGLDRMPAFEQQRQQHSQTKPDIEMEDPFVESSSGTVRRY